MPPVFRTPATPSTTAGPGKHVAGEVPSDSALVSLVLLGDELAARRLRGRHEPMVGPYADHLGAPDGPELLGAAWTRLLEGIRLGSGLDVPVRVAWLSLVAQHATGSGVPRPWVGGDAAWTAFLSLPPAWQVVLWHAEVEGDSPEVLAALAGADQPSVERWTRVARGALRREVVRRHLPTLSDATCLRLATGLLGDLDATASPVELQHLHTHGLGCGSCDRLSADVLRVERDLGQVLAGRVLGDDADWYLGDGVPAPAPAPVPAPAHVAAPVLATAADEPAAEPADDEVEEVAAVVPVPAAARPAPRPAARPAARTASRPAAARRGGSLLVGVAAAAVVAGILVGLRDDAPLEADLEAGGRERTTQAAGTDGADAGPARSARRGGATGATAPAVVPTTTDDAPASAPEAATGVRTAPTAPSGPTPGDGTGGGGTGGGNGDGGPDGGAGTTPQPAPEPAPEPDAPAGTPGLPLRVSVDRESGSATVELDPPLLGGSLSLTTPPLGGSLPTGR